MEYIQRTLEHRVQSAVHNFPVMLVVGARQVGKTTFLKHLSQKDRNYVSLDDPLLLELAKKDPALFMQRFQPPLLIDEIQYAPELLPYIKMLVDSERRPDLYWLTGSQQFQLMKGVSESLAGRVAIFQLLGLSNQEKLGRGLYSEPFLPTNEFIHSRFRSSNLLSLQALYEQIWRGSFPALIEYPDMDRDLFYRSYVSTYLQRDVRDLAKVGDEMAFLRFLRAAAARTAQLLNLSELARDAGISVSTAKSWLSILEASGIVYLLEPWFNNVSKRLIKSPKLYFIDTGLCAYLTEWNSASTLEAGAMSGAILETWILIELLKSYWHNGQRAPFYFYRDKDQKEIDLLIFQNNTLYPLEFKKTASPQVADIKRFASLGNDKVSMGMGGMICLVKQIIPLTAYANAIPIEVC